MGYPSWKRGLDLIFSVLLILLLLPLSVVIALWIKADSQGPILFTQERVGRSGQLFRIYKFRTMIRHAERQGDGFYTGQHDPRITRAGHFLRRWSLDELPQLLNILKGEMSFIGPRPTLAYQVEQYSPRQRGRLAVRPGLTGLAQVSGRNELSWPERIELDLNYVERLSLNLDLYILLRTFRVVLKKDGIYAEKEKFLLKSEKQQYSAKE
ncbi:sugar transferase [Brevibacillus ruminantium]|uniref:Sugar transferase n=1 Tax=Brevibacillus ruminantium TaxID=2950604 RepID=A0ABY4WM75_9BACL|nr:sugar transferase [Brevibacillus ruminantium]USG67142.1 sugar transferase [Brevibacillus ruminantium]